MEELVNRLTAIHNSYFGFVAEIVAYTKRSPRQMNKVLEYLDSSNNLTTSKVVRFVMSQPDFHEHGLGSKEKIG